MAAQKEGKVRLEPAAHPRQCLVALAGVLVQLQKELHKPLYSAETITKVELSNIAKRSNHTLLKFSIFVLKNPDLKDFPGLCEDVMNSTTHLSCCLRAITKNAGKFLSDAVIRAGDEAFRGYLALVHAVGRTYTDATGKKLPSVFESSVSEVSLPPDGSIAGLLKNAVQGPAEEKNGKGPAVIKRLLGAASEKLLGLSSLPMSEAEACLSNIVFNTSMLKDARDEMKLQKDAPTRPENEAPNDFDERLTEGEKKIVPKAYKIIQTSYAVLRRLCQFTRKLSEFKGDTKAITNETKKSTIGTKENKKEGKADKQDTDKEQDICSQRQSTKENQWFQQVVEASELVSQYADEVGSGIYAPQDKMAICQNSELLAKTVDELLQALKSHPRFPHLLEPTKDGKSLEVWLQNAQKAVKVFTHQLVEMVSGDKKTNTK